MKHAIISKFEQEWDQQRPDLEGGHAVTAMHIQVLAKQLAESFGDAVANVDLERWEYDVLSALRRSPKPHELSASEIATANMLSTSAMTHRLDMLEARKLLIRRPHPSDRRRTIVRLTDRGKNLIDKATTLRFSAAKASLKALSKSEHAQLDVILAKLVKSNQAEP